MVTIGDVITLAEAGYKITKAIYEQVKTYQLNNQHIHYLVERVTCLVNIIKTLDSNNINQQTLINLNESLQLLNTHLGAAQKVIESMKENTNWEKMKKFFKAGSYKENLIQVNKQLDHCIQLLNVNIDAQLLANYEKNSTEFLNSLEKDKEQVLLALEKIEESQVLQISKITDMQASLNQFFSEVRTPQLQQISEKQGHTLFFGNGLKAQKGAQIKVSDISNSLVKTKGEMSSEKAALADKELIRRQSEVLITKLLNDVTLEPESSIIIGNVTSAGLIMEESDSSSTPAQLGVFAPKATPKSQPPSQTEKKEEEDNATRPQ